jgi:hypothetical protein
METYAIIDQATNICVNTILWDGVTPYTPPEGTFVVLANGGSIGWIWNGSELVPPPEEQV